MFMEINVLRSIMLIPVLTYVKLGMRNSSGAYFRCQHLQNTNQEEVRIQETN
jgi:hypothetical protein